MVERMPELTTYMADVGRYLLDYPRVTLTDATSFLYWQETGFGLKPTIRISHVTIRENPEGAIVTSKLLYASHYFWTGLELRVLVPDPGRGRADRARRDPDRESRPVRWPERLHGLVRTPPRAKRSNERRVGRSSVNEATARERKLVA